MSRPVDDDHGRLGAHTLERLDVHPSERITAADENLDGGSKVVAHGRYLVFQMAEVAVPRELFGRLLDRIARLRPPDLAPR